jgi:hypothetical protein
VCCWRGGGRYAGGMHGVTTVIVAFVFVCVVFPRLVRNRPQFYAAVVGVLLVILLDSIAHMTAGDSRFRYFAYSMTGLLQIAAIVLLIVSAGGLTIRELGGEFRHAYEVIRRGEEEKEVIIPIGGQVPRRGREQRRGREEEERERYVIDLPEGEEEGEATEGRSDEAAKREDAGEEGEGRRE